MREQQIMNIYLDIVKSEGKKLRDELDQFYNENKSDKKFPFLLRENFQEKFHQFSKKYFLSFPEEFLKDAVWATVTAAKSSSIVSELIDYQNNLLEDYRKNTVQIPPIEDAEN